MNIRVSTSAASRHNYFSQQLNHVTVDLLGIFLVALLSASPSVISIFLLLIREVLWIVTSSPCKLTVPNNSLSTKSETNHCQTRSGIPMDSTCNYLSQLFSKMPVFVSFLPQLDTLTALCKKSFVNSVPAVNCTYFPFFHYL